MNRISVIKKIRKKLKNGKVSIGSWIQIPHASIAEIFGNSGYDWVTIDLEHGSISTHQLPDLFRALESSGTLPLVRLSEGSELNCKLGLDAGAGGVIVPMIENASQLKKIVEYCTWPPKGQRGVGFSRANLFGKNFEQYKEMAQAPIIVAQIENIRAVDNLEKILQVSGLDSILIGPYDLSASMGLTGLFEEPEYKRTLSKIKNLCKTFKIPYGIHIVKPNHIELKDKIAEGYQFIAYSIDSVFLYLSAECPNFQNEI